MKKDYNYGNYWNEVVNDSDLFIKTLLEKFNYFFKKEFLSLIYGNVIMVEIKYLMAFYDRNSKYDLWTLLFHSGYITIVDRKDYKENVKQMDNQLIKILNELESTEDNENNYKKGIDLIQEYKTNSMYRMVEKPRYYVKVPNNEVNIL